MTAKDRMLSYLQPGQYDRDRVMQAVYETQLQVHVDPQQELPLGEDDEATE